MKTQFVTFLRMILMVNIFILLNQAAAYSQNNSGSTKSSTKIEVIYFHAPNRCPSCIATEENTRKFLEKDFRAEMKNNLITFASLDLKEEKNAALVEKYEIVFPTLLILKKQGNKEIKTNFSTTAFQYALALPEKYETLLQAEVNKNLK